MTSAHSLSNRFDSAALDDHTKQTELNYRTSNSQTLPVTAHCLSASHPALWPCLPQPLKHTSWVSKRRRFECTVMLLGHQLVWFFNLFTFYTNTSTLCPSTFVRGFFLQHLNYIPVSESCLSADLCYHSVFAMCFCCDSFPHCHSMWFLLPLWHQDLSPVFPDECLNNK